MRIYLKNSQRTASLNLPRIRRDLDRALRRLGFEQTELSVLFTGSGKMRTLNARYRGLDKVTDVLSFPLTEGGVFSDTRTSGNIALGDIVICIPRAAAQAAEYGVSFYDELLRLLIHGLLHLIGFDHEINSYQKRKMEAKEREIFDAVKKVG